ncbi:PREDICTED: late histone H2B.2.2-like [Nelumbo nucifera]|uniref:Core Histone H2A/H2B/H3 domain-containing protein n=2 Tax=Nelumbo nucifera TaxID=4432 RepID=A0A823A099_NELNU|nr:PREDICTED: late histone H2B.2.2-like [Nelumbo nucifera]DAD48759.1 TPA_asm: hypothetical protein HUJ06_018696 [Nelumbo nucifera]
MAPKRSKKVVGTIVKTTRIRETVRVAVVDGKKAEGETEKETIVESTKEPIRVAIEDVRAPEDQLVQKEPRRVMVDDKVQEEDGAVAVSPETRERGQQEKINQEGKEEKKTEQKGEDKKKKKRERRKGGRRRKEGGEEYKRYVFRVLKQVHPGMGISSKAMAVLNGFMNDMFERLAGEATRLSQYTGKMTLSSREIQGAVRLVLPGELGKHAIAEGTKAVTNYMSNKTAAAQAA